MKKRRFSDARKAKILRHAAETSVTEAARKAKVDRSIIYKWRQTHVATPRPTMVAVKSYADLPAIKSTVVDLEAAIRLRLEEIKVLSAALEVLRPSGQAELKQQVDELVALH